MGLISYAQNFEDIMLWRALGHIEKGSYIDIGAQDPSFDSVSRCFYENGWRGVHVEPTSAYAAMLRDQRPDEIVVEAIAGREHGMSTLFEIPATGLSTGRPDIASHHAERGFPFIERLVPSITLASIFDSLGARDIHWMKIDVEGMERSVLEGWGDRAARPWVLAIESTYPGSRTPTECEWMDLVIERGYREVWFDGLSRFFVAEGHDDLQAAFDLPPNVFDGFSITLNHLMASPLREDHIARESELAKLRSDVEEAHASAEASMAQAHEEERATRLAFQGVLADLSERERQARLQNEESRRALEEVRVKLDEAYLAQQAQRDEFRDLLVAASDRERQARGEISLLKAELKAVEERLDAAQQEARQALREATRHGQMQQAELARYGSWLEEERQRSADLANRLDRMRAGVSAFINRIAAPLAQMQTYLFGERFGLDSGALIASRLDALRPARDAVTSVADLIKTHDEDFIRLAYLVLLGREPDDQGRDYYLGRLRAGETKDCIIAQLVRSAEARRYGSALQGLGRLKRRGLMERLFGRRRSWATAQGAASRFENALGRELPDLFALID